MSRHDMLTCVFYIDWRHRFRLVYRVQRLFTSDGRLTYYAEFSLS